jgi:hypothetical protein
MAYSIDELLDAAKAVLRGSVAGVGTEEGTDFDLTVNAAARLFHGTQVAGAHVLAQLDPEKADADRRDQLVGMLGLNFTREATPARGLIAITPSQGRDDPFTMLAGTEIVFPGEVFADGVERTYRTLSDVVYTFSDQDVMLALGTGIRKLVPKVGAAAGVGVGWIGARMLLVVSTGTAPYFDTENLFVRSVNLDDQSVDLLAAVRSAISVNDNTNRIFASSPNALVEAECTTPGAAGNAPYVVHRFVDESVDVADGKLMATLVEMSGGGDAVGDIDVNSARVSARIEDTLAMPPGYGNAQHWRELALSCPDVDLDDVLVYQHVRGPGTIDLVCIGRRGSVRATAYPGVNLSFCGWGNNSRRIGEAQAARVTNWCRSQASYFDDLVARSVEWDWRGNAYPVANYGYAFREATSALELSIEAQPGYGPDCGKALDVTPYERHATRLYASTSGAQVDPSLRPGQRVWATVGHLGADKRHAFATVVTPILNIAGDRTYVEIADVSTLGPGEAAVLSVLRWGSAGPLTEACVDAVFAYYDALGPGSYLEPPHSANYVAHYSSDIAPIETGQAVTRWPPEGRRWASSLRASELRAELLTIEGVSDVQLYPVGTLGGLIDFDPVVFCTLALTGVVPRSA